MAGTPSAREPNKLWHNINIYVRIIYIMLRKKHFLVIVALALLSIGGFLFIKNSLSKPNVILIILDAARSDHFSCYGYKKQTTPYIDSIANGGAAFLNNFSQSTYTYASLPQLFYSRYFSKEIFENDAGIWNTPRSEPQILMQDFDSQQIMLQRVLAINGYNTVIFSQHRYLTPQTLLAKSFHEYFQLPVLASTERTENISMTVTPVVDWIIKNAKHRYFVYMHMMFPHQPYDRQLENKQFLYDNLGKPILPEELVNTRNKMDVGTDFFNGNPKPDINDIRCLPALYDCNLNYADSVVGTLYSRLKELGLIKNTIFIITADHGEGLGEHNSIGHGPMPWDIVTKIPLIMSYPGRIPRGFRYNHFTELIDVMPTILGICKIKLPSGKTMDGTNLLPALRDGRKSKTAVYSTDSIRTDAYKYIISTHQLYKMSSDPDENNNIAFREPQIAADLVKRYNDTMKPKLRRFINAKKQNQPDHPFHFPITSFDISPIDANNDYIKISRVHPYNKILFKPGPPVKHTLNLAADVPSGVYEIALILSSSRTIEDIGGEFYLRYRFEQRDPYGIPVCVPIKNKDYLTELTKQYFYELRLGKTQIHDNRLLLQIEYQPPANTYTSIMHTTFYPEDSRKTMHNGAQSPYFDKRIKELKALGYM
jgi:arylsulfatase A-like enzyme